MGLLIIDKHKLVDTKVKTTPELVDEANWALFRAKMTLPAANGSGTPEEGPREKKEVR